MSWRDNRTHWEGWARSVDPAIRLVDKESSPLMRAYARLPWLGDEFLTRTASVIGARIYLTRGGDAEHDIAHEGRHVRQKRWCSLGLSPWLGWPVFAVLCVFVLPAGLTARFWFEMDAEAFALKQKVRTGSSVAWARYSLVEFAELLCGGDYVWAWWPRRWAKKIAGLWKF